MINLVSFELNTKSSLNGVTTSKTPLTSFNFQSFLGVSALLL